MPAHACRSWLPISALPAPQKRVFSMQGSVSLAWAAIDLNSWQQPSVGLLPLMSSAQHSAVTAEQMLVMVACTYRLEDRCSSRVLIDGGTRQQLGCPSHCHLQHVHALRHICCALAEELLQSITVCLEITRLLLFSFGPWCMPTSMQTVILSAAAQRQPHMLWSDAKEAAAPSLTWMAPKTLARLCITCREMFMYSPGWALTAVAVSSMQHPTRVMSRQVCNVVVSCTLSHTAQPLEGHARHMHACTGAAGFRSRALVAELRGSRVSSQQGMCGATDWSFRYAGPQIKAVLNAPGPGCYTA